MDEDSYRQLYERINTAPCVFEKGILSLKCKCAYQHQFRLADRHGVGCTDTVMQQNCSIFLDYLRKQTRFVFKIDIDGPMPHNKEIKVQNGGMLGVQKLLMDDAPEECVENISGLLTESIKRFGAIENIPYNQIMPYVTAYQTRPKRRKDK